MLDAERFLSWTQEMASKYRAGYSDSPPIYQACDEVLRVFERHMRHEVRGQQLVADMIVDLKVMDEREPELEVVQ